jgi:ubiquinone/menaquinone biosynthesis C-methylase UbiE
MITSFDNRIVRYEDIHNIKKEHFKSLCKIIVPKNDMNILDLGCGYAACTREIISSFPHFLFNFTLMDSSQIQIKRAEKEINLTLKKTKSNSLISYINEDILYTKLSSQSFDVIIAKMLIHEIPKHFQLKAIKQMYRLLTKGGLLIIWDLNLDKNNQGFINKIFAEKDLLCNYVTLFNNRYFYRVDELYKNLLSAKFTTLKKEKNILSTFICTENRLQQEFEGDRIKLRKWIDYIRTLTKKIKPFTLIELFYKDKGYSLEISPPQSIITARKE